MVSGECVRKAALFVALQIALAVVYVLWVLPWLSWETVMGYPKISGPPNRRRTRSI